MTREEFDNLEKGDYVYFEKEIEHVCEEGCTFNINTPYKVSDKNLNKWIIIGDEEHNIFDHGWKYEDWSLYEDNSKSIYELLDMEVIND